MHETIATNIRRLREHRAWTQEHLAGAATLSPRTVQRAEEGLPMSADTLIAIAGALDVTVDVLRFDEQQLWANLLGVRPDEVTPELLTAKAEEAKAKYMFVDLEAATQAASLSGVFDADAMHFNCIPPDDETQDLAAELRDLLGDLMDLAGVMSATHARENLKAAFQIVERLRALKRCVSVGLHAHGLKLTSGETIPWRSLYVIISTETDVRKFVMVEKGAKIRL